MPRNPVFFPMAVLAFATAACSGSGISTTAMTTTVAGDSGSADDGGGSNATDADGGDDSSGGGADSGSADGGSDPTAADDGGSSGAADTGAGNDSGGEAITIVGTWLSEGDDIAPILVQLTHAVTINAVFAEDAFTVDTVDEDGQEVEQVGVYTIEPSGFGDIYNITLMQNMPSAIVVEGIFEIDDTMSPAMMRYEVVQTSPSVGATAPTADAGFGATSYGSDLTQVFRRQ